jgi:hypothetical protein
MKNTFLLLTIFFLLFSSCEKEIFYEDKNDDNIVINNDSASLSRRMDFDNSGKKVAVQPGVNISLIANLLPPSLNSEVLQASHIRIAGNYAYITYNTQGPRYLGAVDIVNISNAYVPQLISNAIWDGKDISSIDVDPKGAGLNNFVWIVGAEENNTNLATPAILERYILNSANQFVHVNEPRQFYDLPGYVGTDVRYFHKIPGSPAIYATSGTDGGLSILNNGTNLSSYKELQNARSVDVNSNYLVSLSGNPGSLFVSPSGEIEVGGATDPEAKSMVRLSGNYALVALGEEGVKCYNLSTNQLVGSFPRPEVPVGAYEWDYVSNGVAVYNDLVYVANGAAGIDVLRLNSDGSLTWVSNIDLGASANFIDVNSNYIFVATGLGGLKILKIC